MAIDATYGTKLANLFNPQVVGDLVAKKLTDYIKFRPLATVDRSLMGVPGNTLSLPSYSYIGDASTVNEGADIPIAQLIEGTTTVTVHKYGKGVSITDEAVLSGFGNPLDEATNQIALALASAVDNEYLTVLNGIASGMTHTCASTTLTADDIADALVLFGEDIDGDKVLLVNPADYNVLRKADDWIAGTEAAANMIIAGAVGTIHGCQVVVSNKLTTPNKSYIVKPGALREIPKRDVLIETERQAGYKSTNLFGDINTVAYLYDASKAIKIVKGAASG